MMLVAVSCGADDATTTATEAVASDGCQTALAKPGAYQGINDSADVAQNYWVVVPDGYADMAPVPLVFFLSGGFGEADVNYEHWRPYLDDAKSLFVIADAPGIGEQPSWPTEVHIALIDEIALDYCIDIRHVHAVGQSSSASKAIRLACDAPDRIASVAASIGRFVNSCEPTRPIPLLSFTGDDDRVRTTRSAEWWAELNGCAPEPVDVDLGSGVTRRTYQDCSASVVLYHIAGGSHGVFFRTCIGRSFTPVGSTFCQENEVVNQLEEMDQFFAEHPLTSSG